MHFNKTEFNQKQAQINAELSQLDVAFERAVQREYGMTAEQLSEVNKEFLNEVKEQMRQQRKEAEALYRNSIIDDPIAMFVHGYE